MDWHYTAGLAEGLILGIMTAVGTAAIHTGWVPGWERGRVFRPRLWGQGLLLLAVSLALPVIALALAGPTVFWLAACLVGGAGVVVGAALMHRSRRDRRRGSPTTAAS
ncbi:hypothetical protein [Streptomyces sporangiiformans]|uniref:Uncharacterized protein n=1 Tax=Streptomyces sporangiiformans TaxID=2315329 RepID=A0A505DMC3_9ACTN|nr:hypothetical protein [Streptomyces sporangiiformans]TPQ21409.1 hypothetical protein FGD71_015270 [Streptomyces sporangiiformans]